VPNWSVIEPGMNLNPHEDDDDGDQQLNDDDDQQLNQHLLNSCNFGKECKVN